MRLIKISFAIFSIIFLLQKITYASQVNNNGAKSTEKKLGKDINNEIKKIADDDKGIFSAILENDLFTNTDRGYTNGVRFSYISPEEKMPKFLRSISNYLPIINKKAKKRISLAFGQNMYAPRDITKSEFTPNDFLYAGWLYGSLGVISDSGSSYDNTVLTLGTVGPASGAAATQDLVHHIKAGAAQPQGWDNQLRNEPGIIFTYERKWRNILELSPFGIGIDAIPHLGVNLGNILTNAAFGATLRIGYDLPADYGPPRIRPNLPGADFFIPSKKLGGYLFLALEERALARNIFLDGNSFIDSQHVAKRNFVSSAQFGTAVTYKDFQISYSYIFIGKEFRGEKSGSKFGAITASYRF